MLSKYRSNQSVIGPTSSGDAVTDLTGSRISGGGTVTAISQGTGTNIGDLTAGGGLAGAFDGNQATSAEDTGGGSGYVGKTYSPARRVIGAKMLCDSSNGWNTAADPELKLYGKNGTAPSSETDGTLLGSIKFRNDIDSTHVVMIFAESNDSLDGWEHVWVRTHGGAGSVYIGELTFYELA